MTWRSPPGTGSGSSPTPPLTTRRRRRTWRRCSTARNGPGGVGAAGRGGGARGSRSVPAGGGAAACHCAPPRWRENSPVTGQLWPGLLAEAWAALDGDAAAVGRLPAGLEVLWVSGEPGRLPSRLPAEEVAVACTAAALLAAAALHAQRGGDGGSRGSPAARLDRAHIAAAFRSEAYLRVGGKPA